MRKTVARATAFVLSGLLITGVFRAGFDTGSAGGSSVNAGAIRHVVIIMHGNRSFDSYFGTFPEADGIPMSGGAAERLSAGSQDAPLRAAVPRSV